jgi:hypothetical protein
MRFPAPRGRSARAAEALRKPRNGSRRFCLPTLTRHAHAREGQSPPSPQPSAGIAPPEPHAQAPAGRIASPSAGCGSHLAPIRDRGAGAFPPPGALGPIGGAGGPSQTLIEPLYNKANGLGEFAGAPLRGIRS